ncbi:MAG: serine/threonine protein kinase [Anaerolineae bacterium]|nr:serine/threonine protein kinase [Anaerolineae bacterium]
MANLIGKKLGNYKLSALLGQGGMAAVYRARQENMGRDVAIKVIDTSDDPKDFKARFQREAQMIASLSHPHIIKVFDYGIQDQYVFLVMELLPGGTLGKLFRKGPFPVKAAYRVISQLAEALDYAHAKNLIHRDLKPQNVLLDENRNVILTDFGIAKLWQRFSLNLGQYSEKVTGTPAYMAPEQWRNEDITPRTDIYALGVMMFEMLTGRLPFSGGTAKSMMYLHMYHKAPPIRSLRPEISESIEYVVNQAMAKSAADRYPSAGELLVAFRTALMGGSVGEPEFKLSFNEPASDSAADSQVFFSVNPQGETEDDESGMHKMQTIDVDTSDPDADLLMSDANSSEETIRPRPQLKKISVNQIRQLGEESKPRKPQSLHSIPPNAALNAPAKASPARAKPMAPITPLPTSPNAAADKPRDVVDELRGYTAQDLEKMPTGVGKIKAEADKVGLSTGWIIAAVVAIAVIVTVLIMMLRL